MKIVISLLIFMLPLSLLAQEQGDILLGTQMDIVKSGNDSYFEGVQIGLEGNYFLSKKFSGSAGLEIWSRQGLSGAIGMRWLPSQDSFIRVRGLLGVNDISIGAGFAKPIGEQVRIEAMTDFYFSGSFTIRAGFAFMIKK